ncbi:hypothetical protein JRO89_XS02G0258900 [Xanthoceras sorbifolium]|uniref:RanBP2-type domain-containing protein n=1 Tax=Xanthoceras sorbifolium TaxID=99658 RepID=A0ABQ8IH87_9ROSI|nr:hypothetical protein JRO89_XS02G0258900 [Xanthoceras sorbifolium]
MDLGARRYTRNDILRDICCLIAPPIYSFIYKIVEVEHTDQLQLNDIQVDPSNTPTDQIGKVEDTKTSQLSNIYDVEPSNSQSNEVQQIPNTLRNTCAQSNDQGQVDPSNTRIAHIGNAEDTNPSPLSNTCEPSDTPIKDFVPSRSHSDEVQQVPNMLRKRRNTFKQSDQGEENKLNFRRRDWCQRCGEPRTGYHKGSFGGRISGSGPDVRPGDWYCMNCAAHNLACRSSCFKCGASNDEPGSDMPKIRGFGFGSGSSGRKSGDWISTRFHGSAWNNSTLLERAEAGRLIACSTISLKISKTDSVAKIGTTLEEHCSTCHEEEDDNTYGIETAVSAVADKGETATGVDSGETAAGLGKAETTAGGDSGETATGLGSGETAGAVREEDDPAGVESRSSSYCMITG